MKIDQKELDRRAAEADRARLMLRRATLELLGARQAILDQLSERITKVPTLTQNETNPRPAKPKEHSGDSESEFPL